MLGAVVGGRSEVALDNLGSATQRNFGTPELVDGHQLMIEAYIHRAALAHSEAFHQRGIVVVVGGAEERTLQVSRLDSNHRHHRYHFQLVQEHLSKPAMS